MLRPVSGERTILSPRLFRTAGMTASLRSFLAAVQFLTIIPVRLPGRLSPSRLGKSLHFFPVVGAGIGILLATAAGIFYLAPAAPAAALTVILSVLVHGGLHLDGFADTCDGLAGGRDAAAALAIMRDSRIGAMGAAAISGLLLLKWAVLVSLPVLLVGKALFCMALFSRWAQVLACVGTRYPRAEGRAQAFIAAAGWPQAVAGGAAVILIFAAVLGHAGLAVFGLSVAAVLAVKYYIQRRIGGMTGDTIGAVNEIGEVSVLFFTLVAR
ncbi:MAG: adenosylcobinamide-GDP ribazoletransferase [Candidatus Omnitrophica bacterium]|nr:adenosylcobinamide-GDP ribazoletransferase [Candidatus Omnitrophota bacterium]